MRGGLFKIPGVLGEVGEVATASTDDGRKVEDVADGVGSRETGAEEG